MDKLIQSFSILVLADFFKKAISSFKIEIEDINHYIEDKDFSQFSELARIGNVSFKNSDELIVFACKYNGVLWERSSKKKQFEIAKLVLKEDFKDGAIFVFYDKSGKFRFSFIRRNWNGKADKKYSPWKRFTYFVTPEDTNKTFKQRIGNCTFKDLDSIQEAFSVEKLTKEFYNDLFKWYQWTLTTEVGITFPNDTATSEDDRVKLEEQMIRLITRLLFVWFIKQKHLVPDELFKIEKLSEILKDFDPNNTSDGSYYNAILQNLFFATLNKAVTEREFAKLVDKRDIKTRYRYAEMFNISEEEILNLFRPIPFLNGGLFECLDKEESTDGIKYHLDGFSRSDKRFPNGNFKHRAFIPNAVFFDEDKGLIPLLERYNFTVEENVSNEVQVALDPELLGNVFENLLGAFNPETQESARKQSGSFYTPKEIVVYMVDESLISYLNYSLPDLDEELIRQLFEQDALPKFLANNHALCEKIAKKLRSVKILDPACGSGAFPMGILNRMVEILEKLDARNNASHHDLKLHLIEECIYGVDIQTIAAQISKLRFFISLIVEQEVMDISKPEENYGVLTLPNLETKFVAANTLIGMKKKKEGDFVNSLFTDPRIDETKHQLMEVRKEHFYAKSAYKKKELRDKDASLRAQLSKLLQDNNEFAPEEAIQFSQWNPYDQNASSPFFDPEWMFGLSKENGGLNSTDGGYFDIVLANPPYVEAKKLKHISNQLKSYSVYAGTADLSSYFFEKGIELCKPKGTLCYINTNKFFNTGYGKPLRNFLLKYQIDSLINFEQVEVFEKVLVSSVIIKITKKVNDLQKFYFKKFYKLKREDFKKHFVKENLKGGYYSQTDLTEAEWSFADNRKLQLKQKIEQNATIMKDLKGVSIYRGVTTGYNPAFIVDEDKKSELIKEPKNKDVIKPLLQGRDIRKWQYKKSKEHLIFIPWHFPLHLDTSISGNSLLAEKQLQNEYSVLYKHLERFKENLLNRNKEETGIRYEWYALQRCAASYFPEFEKTEKIVWGLTADKWAFAYDDRQHFLPSNGYILTSNEIPIKYLLGILNSDLLKFYFGFIGVMTAGGAYTLKHATIQQLPIVITENQSIIIDLVNDILQKAQQGKDISEVDIELNSLIYSIYGLTYHEIKIINPNFSLSEQEYNKFKI
ncbi:Eco57I restriction-modification methylase domain-containing protein [Sphingobacterium multivorum]